MIGLVVLQAQMHLPPLLKVCLNGLPRIYLPFSVKGMKRQVITHF
nr:hypothetical protein HCAJSMRY_HCAJSMRY_CDS_0004 [Microvirus sp.]